MLKREEVQPEQAAGEVRVKKEELARAISILEARRQAEAQAQEGTVVIGDVLQQLQITVPAEDVLHEIEALRDGQPQEEVLERPVDPLRTTDAKLIAGIVLVPLVAVVLGGLIFHPISPSPPPLANNPSSWAFSNPYSMSAPILMPPPLNSISGITGQEMDKGGFNASSVLKPLSAVPDNQPVRCNSDSLRRLISSEMQRKKIDPIGVYHTGFGDGKFPGYELNAARLANSDQKFDVRSGLNKPWQIIKHDGNLYIRGWVAAKFTNAQGAAHFVVLQSSPRWFDAGIIPQKITLKASFVPFYGLGGVGVDGMATQLSVRNATADGHAWEKW